MSDDIKITLLLNGSGERATLSGDSLRMHVNASMQQVELAMRTHDPVRLEAAKAEAARSIARLLQMATEHCIREHAKAIVDRACDARGIGPAR
jgi:hypothetical protein